MIAEAFLICALSPTPAMAFTQANFSNGAARSHTLVVKSSQFLLYGKSNQKANLLVVGGNPEWVNILRQEGFKAFGALTDDRPGITPYHAVTNAGSMSFLSRVFNIVIWVSANPLREVGYEWIKEAVRLTEPGGFIVFNERHYEEWPKMLRHWNWERLPIVFGHLSIWQRPIDLGSFTYAYKRTLEKMGKNVVPFKQLWQMRQILASA